MSGLINSTGSKSGIIDFYSSNRPSFLVWLNSSSPSGDPVLFNDTSSGRAHNNGGHYSTSTGKFTAPVTGTYLFSFGGIKGNSSSVGRMSLKVQNSDSGLIQVRWEENSAYAWGTATNTVEMNASWYATIHLTAEAPWSDASWSSNNPFFSGHLIG